MVLDFFIYLGITEPGFNVIEILLSLIIFSFFNLFLLKEIFICRPGKVKSLDSSQHKIMFGYRFNTSLNREVQKVPEATKKSKLLDQNTVSLIELHHCVREIELLLEINFLIRVIVVHGNLSVF